MKYTREDRGDGEGASRQHRARSLFKGVAAASASPHDPQPWTGTANISALTSLGSQASH
jgi:hypothetical protein